MTATHTQQPDLGSCLTRWAGHDQARLAVADTVGQLAQAAIDLARRLRQSVFTDDFDEIVGLGADGDDLRHIDLIADELLVQALGNAPVAAVASRQSAGVIVLQPGAPLLVSIAPLDDSANLAVDAPTGMIFAMRPAPPSIDLIEASFLRPGTEQVAAGLVLFGPVTVLMLTVGAGTDVFAVDTESGCFRRTRHALRTPRGTREYAIDASNARHWTANVRAYVDDLTAGCDGLRRADFTMTWFGALVADAHRILIRGGVFLSPGDARPGHGSRLVRLVFEARPIAMLVEQADGSATDGHRRLLPIAATHLGACTTLIFGSADKVARVGRYHTASPYEAERAPLFGQRGLYR